MLGNRQIMAANIRYYLDRSGKTRNEICKDLGFKYSTFTDWINGKKYPRIDKIEMMANYFHITKADLVEDRNFFPAASSADQLSHEETRLIDSYRALNQEGKEILLDYADTLVQSKKYNPNGSIALGEQASE